MPEARLIDHLVLPVADLSRGRSRLEALGFAVAPDALHPFGTANACVFLADGTYLEPLAVVDSSACDTAVRDGNVFVVRDRAFRHRVGPDGLSAVVFASSNAGADDRAFHSAGFSLGPMLTFSRVVQKADGSPQTASFHLAFAGEAGSPDFFAFCCERVNATAFPPAPAHPNGVRGLRGIVLSASEPALAARFMGELTGAAPVRQGDDRLDFRTGNAWVSVLAPDAVLDDYGVEASGRGDGLRGEGVVFLVDSLALTAQCLRENTIAFVRQAARLVVRPTAGQGAFFAFEE